MNENNENKFTLSTITQKEPLAPGICKITFSTDECKFTSPGQYAMINVDGVCRPFQVCDFDSNRFTVVADENYSTGHKLSEKNPGDQLMTETGLGNGFDFKDIPDGAWLVADSSGIPEMLELARGLLIRGKSFRTVLGYKTKDEIFMVDSFRTICNELEILTQDGSNGREGSAADAVRKASYVCASGDKSTLKKLAGKTQDGQFSFSNMMSLSDSKDAKPNVYVGSGDEVAIVEGPVFDKRNINWDMI